MADARTLSEQCHVAPEPIGVPSTPVKSKYEARPGTPSTCPCSPSSTPLASRVAALKESALSAPKPKLLHVWPEGRQNDMHGASQDDPLWEEILVKFGACGVPALRTAEHFEDIIRAGMNANAVTFPPMNPRRGFGPIIRWPAEHSDVPSCCQDLIPFPFLETSTLGSTSCTSDAERDAIEALNAGRAKHSLDLRKSMYSTSEPIFDMELVSWSPLENGVIAADECTEFQLRVWELREARPLSTTKLESRRLALAQKLKGDLNSRVFEELYPTLEPEAARLEWKAARARDKAEEQRQYDELAERGAAFVVWVLPGERRWPELPSAWKRHCKWFAMWRSRPRAASCFAFQPLKRSTSESSLQSWAVVSDISWDDVETKASECGWKEVLDEHMPALTAAQVGMNLTKADIVELKSFKTPPNGVRLAMEVICILLQVVPNKTENGGTDYWEASKALLAEPDFMDRVLSLRDYVPSSALDAAAPYMSLEEFTPDVMKKAAAACEGMCKFAREVYKYHVLSRASAEEARRNRAGKSAEEIGRDLLKACEELTKSDIQELKAMAKPPAEIALVTSCLLHLFAGVDSEIDITSKGFAKDASWKGCQKLLSNPASILIKLQTFKGFIDAGKCPQRNIRKVRRIQANMGGAFSAEAICKKSKAAASLCTWLASIVAYYDVSAPFCQADVDATTAKANVTPSEVVPPSPWSGLAGDLAELKALSNPPRAVMIVCMCVCILRPLGKENADAGWAGAKAMLSNVKLLKALASYDKEAVTDEQRAKVRELLDTDKQTFDGNNVKHISKAANELLQWVRAIID